ncbi:GntR family transcriptional regulator [Pseudonocardia alni]|uniref:GntR family transcriptional regulator n=1 Tax=Pseudonocardia alni TaxID=33907 RepID=UPI0027A3F351|nr:GntR family transcriptional regulator [Pseudonocardia alni]
MATTGVAYRVLARDLRTAIFDGRYPDGTALPTEAVLARQYGVSRQTVRRAFHDLVAEGMVTRVRGRGTFAARRDGAYLQQFGSIEDLMGMAAGTTREILQPLHRRIDIDVAARLEIDGDAVFTFEVLRRHRGAPLCVTAVHLTPEVGVRLDGVPELCDPASTSNATAIGLLDKHLRLPIAEAEQSITAAAATAGTAGHLSCTPGDPLLRIDRLYRTTEHIPVELATSHFLPSQYSYRVKLRRTLR